MKTAAVEKQLRCFMYYLWFGSSDHAGDASPAPRRWLGLTDRLESGREEGGQQTSRLTSPAIAGLYRNKIKH